MFRQTKNNRSISNIGYRYLNSTHNLFLLHFIYQNSMFIYHFSTHVQPVTYLCAPNSMRRSYTCYNFFHFPLNSSPLVPITTPSTSLLSCCFFAQFVMNIADKSVPLILYVYCYFPRQHNLT